MFKGFTDRTMDFLIAISFNNNREFFHENHDWYMESVRGPLLDLAAELAPTIEAIDPELERRPERAVSRINRDLRFSKDKSPYRDWMWIGFHHPANKHGFPSFYVDISAQRMGYGIGFWEDNRPMLDAHRLYLQNHAEEFLKMITPAVQGMDVEARCYKKMALPEGLKDEVKSWYPLRSLFVYKNISDSAIIQSPDLAKIIIKEYEKLAPIYKYFAALKPIEV